jgi:hypothetical protein
VDRAARRVAAEEKKKKEGRGEGPGSRADAGPRRLGKAPSSAGEGRTPEGAVTRNA